ncbi:hypothetical protein IFM89_000266 [Coptis chinensis]|uniref:Uncharacterized protein n=1 Tax=Coptis chinensis TaxID=261450 RepID=A0A835LH95_9MAGN|nr:hypothetical protein IFM89_000266 [Coptis chinensis]
MPVARKIAKRALSVLEKWKAKIETEEGSGGVGHVEAATFLQDEGPSAVLAQQIEDETVKFAHYLGIKVVSIEEHGFKIRRVDKSTYFILVRGSLNREKGEKVMNALTGGNLEWMDFR